MADPGCFVWAMKVEVDGKALLGVGIGVGVGVGVGVGIGIDVGVGSVEEVTCPFPPFIRAGG